MWYLCFDSLQHRMSSVDACQVTPQMNQCNGCQWSSPQMLCCSRSRKSEYSETSIHHSFGTFFTNVLRFLWSQKIAHFNNVKLCLTYCSQLFSWSFKDTRCLNCCARWKHLIVCGLQCHSSPRHVISRNIKLGITWTGTFLLNCFTFVPWRWWYQFFFKTLTVQPTSTWCHHLI